MHITNIYVYPGSIHHGVPHACMRHFQKCTVQMTCTLTIDKRAWLCSSRNPPEHAVKCTVRIGLQCDSD